MKFRALPLNVWLHLIFFIVGVVLLSVIYYFSVRFITGDDDFFDLPYGFRLLLASLITIVVAPFFQAITPRVLSGIGSVLAFIIIMYSVRFLLIEPITSREEWEKSIWISLVAIFTAYIINLLAVWLFNSSVVPVPF